jgi:hypothetical protein
MFTIQAVTLETTTDWVDASETSDSHKPSRAWLPAPQTMSRRIAEELTCRMVPVSDRNMSFQLTIDESAAMAWLHFGLPDSPAAAKFTSEFIKWDYSGEDNQGRASHAYFELNRMKGTFFTRGYNGSLQRTCSASQPVI